MLIRDCPIFSLTFIPFSSSTPNADQTPKLEFEMTKQYQMSRKSLKFYMWTFLFPGIKYAING